jgi:imidazole glycerol-phosphate synthase subunit HisF
MLRSRLIPTLLIEEGGLVKGSEFQKHKYVGDPINAVKLFNDKEVDELILFDISVTNKKSDPDYKMIQDIVSEAFMPIGYGGGVSSMTQVEKLFKIGIEKIVINSAAFHDPSLISQISKVIGSQSTVVSIDVRKSLFGKYEVFVNNGTKNTKISPIEYAQKMEKLGAGEIIVTSINKEGKGGGYDIGLLESVSSATSIPIVGSGGAGNLGDVLELNRNTSVAAAAAGSMFIFHGKHKAVLINYPEYGELERLYAK